MTTCALAALLLAASPSWEDGSLVVLENSNKPVANYTSSDVTHVGVLLHIAGDPWVYEATPSQVRHVSLSSYRQEIGYLNRSRRKKTRIWILEPKQSYSSQQLRRMKGYLHSQLGRRYSVKGYVRDRQADGIHCAELTATALMYSGRVRLKKPYAISPASLVRGVRPLHRAPSEVFVPVSQPQGSWCSRAWERWFSFQAWCRWASYEAWALCW